MKIPRLVAAAWLLISTPTHTFAGTGLLGCPSPSKLAERLAKVQTNDWKTISVARLQSIWPESFDEIVCENSNGCRFLVSKQRVINGHCECCVTFKFDLKQNDNGAKVEILNNIMIHYSNRDKADVVETARRLARASGLSDADIAKINDDERGQRYELERKHNGVGENYILEMQIN